MNYPITARELDGDIASDDEIATMIVIEAIVTDTFESIDFIDSIDPTEVRHRVENWEHFREYSYAITRQKDLLTSILPSEYNNVRELNDAQIADSYAIAAEVVSQRTHELHGQKNYKRTTFVSTAAAITLVFIGLFAFMNVRDRNTAPSRVQAIASTTTQNRTSVAEKGRGAQAQSPSPESQDLAEANKTTTATQAQSPTSSPYSQGSSSQTADSLSSLDGSHNSNHAQLWGVIATVVFIGLVCALSIAVVKRARRRRTRS